MPPLKLHYRTIASLIPFARNARTHSDEQIRRFQQNHPDVAITLAATGQSFGEVATPRLGVHAHLEEIHAAA
jgi:hypothetical protein